MTTNLFISVVEDDDSLREALIGLLRSHGYPARGFSSAEEFLAVQDGRCGCVITDVRMPGLSGVELAGRLRELGHKAPVIMITARTDPAIEQQAGASGAICLLRKPFEARELMDCVERALAA